MYASVINDVSVDAWTKWSKVACIEDWTDILAVSIVGKGNRLIRRTLKIVQWGILKSQIPCGQKDQKYSKICCCWDH
jgi:hypothetical protein